MRRDAGREVNAAPVVLAIHPGALGDVLLAVPALRALGTSGRATVMLAAQPRLGALLERLGVVGAHASLERLGLDALFVDDPARRPRLPPVARLVSWMGAQDATFVRRLRALVPEAVVAPSLPAAGEVWAHLLATTGAPPGGGLTAAVRVPPALQREGAEALTAAGWDGRQRVLLVQPGAGSPAKCWPAEGFAEVLAREAGEACVVIHQGPADAAAVAALRARLPQANVLLEPPLERLAGVLAHAAAWLGNDSGPSHLAVALGRPAVVLFDARHLAWRPWRAASVRVVSMGRMEGPEVRDVETVAATVRAALASPP
jgi:ADP-heptose:LPS heptosyltransferase